MSGKSSLIPERLQSKDNRRSSQHRPGKQHLFSDMLLPLIPTKYSYLHRLSD